MFAAARRTALTLAAALAITSCGGSDPVSVQSPETITYAAFLGVDLPSMTRKASGLYIKDLIVGDGAEAVNGKLLGVRYLGYLNNGVLFDSRSTSTFTFTLGAHEVIAGWDEGVAGMKVGGRRQLVVPASLGYGNAGRDMIPPGAVLVFTVDLVALQ